MTAALEALAARLEAATISDDARERVLDALGEIEHRERITIIFAVESGSRAWGHASPDSDYDVRFVYRRPLASYLTVGKRRDVLELGLTGDLDLAGWDINKTLALLINGNPAILEWLTSPIVYMRSRWCENLNALADRCPHKRAAYWHYRALARRQRELLSGEGPVKLKRYFYVIRPALAVTWLKQHEDSGRVPMSMPHLLAGVDIPGAVRASIAALAAQKEMRSELGVGPRIPEIDDFIASALDGADEPPDMTPSPKLVTEADALFRAIVGAPCIPSSP